MSGRGHERSGAVYAGARRFVPAALTGLTGLAVAALLAGCVRSLVPIVQAEIPPDTLLIEQHRRLVEEGQALSRAGTPPPRAQWQTSGNTIVQIPISGSPGGVAIGRNFAAKTLPIVPNPPPPCPYNPAAVPVEKTASLLITFPSMSWHVCVTDNYRTSLWIGPVHMLGGPNDPWIKVIERAGLAEIFVPYHQINFRPYDLQATYQLQSVGSQDLDIGDNGMLVQLTNEPVWPTVVATTRDRGIGWICPGKPTRRAEEFLIWGVADGGNYDNVIEYGFRDDGTITFQLGNTGYNSPKNPVEPHTHVALWYVDTELTPFGNPVGESAYWLTHVEPSLSTLPNSAADLSTAIAIEGAHKWDERDFATLVVEDGIGNPLGHNIGYQFSPLRNSLSRHFGPKESWTQNDVYVTRAHPAELGWIRNFDEPDDYLMTYLNGESVVGQDLAVWIKTAAHHHPTDEDRTVFDFNTGGTTGVTLMHWSGFKMEPRNFFPRNPLGGPVRCGN